MIAIKYLKPITLIIFSIVLISCDSNNELVEINDFSGFYKIKSITSSIPIDLNNDGLKSEDYLQEIKSPHVALGKVVDYHYDNEEIPNFAEVRPTTQQTLNDVQFLDIPFPIQKIDTFYYVNGDFYMYTREYRNMYTGFIYKLTNDNIEIESDPFNHFEFYDIKNFQINRINKIEFEVIFYFKVFDFLDNEWVETSLVGRYENVGE